MEEFPLSDLQPTLDSVFIEILYTGEGGGWGEGRGVKRSSSGSYTLSIDRFSRINSPCAGESALRREDLPTPVRSRVFSISDIHVSSVCPSVQNETLNGRAQFVKFSRVVCHDKATDV